ncbi:uncharacterized protein LOC131537218 [Onychostoma macrolepis]|uniref:uncharacterized protein LOC131537218 n=1 Tax=Onychostoma macrolepis TaxID=369639 RepID=UPI00272AFC6A|nr:uncharacterized protein LOC131537218 [Onychostoma macrolepis]XP_058626510.1 uncharacterized protein LOC131537218 [Onychostoma macrolepis]XP_058626511.1 uncharacterized protein LOC131537218 [Onychostoma macrolepis]
MTLYNTGRCSKSSMIPGSIKGSGECEVKVVQLVEDRQGMTRSNQRLQRWSYDVADQTCSLSLTVWGGDVLEIRKWYTTKNASVRQFDGYTCLSTTSQSSLTIVLDVSATVAQPVDSFTVKEGEIVTADVKAQYMFPKMHTLLAVNLTRCQQCAAYCKTAKVKFELNGTVTVQDNTDNMSTFVLDDFVLRQLMTVPADSQVEPDVLAAKLLSDDKCLHIKFRGQCVMCASFVFDSDSANQSTEAEQNDGVKSSGTVEECAQPLSEDLMLEQLFADETVEPSQSQGLGEKGKRS